KARLELDERSPELTTARRPLPLAAPPLTALTGRALLRPGLRRQRQHHARDRAVLAALADQRRRSAHRARTRDGHVHLPGVPGEELDLTAPGQTRRQLRAQQREHIAQRRLELRAR